MERQRFDNLYKRMDRDLQRLKQEIGSVIDESTSAYDSRCVGDVMSLWSHIVMRLALLAGMKRKPR